MAGSYSHATTDAGNLRDNESFVNMIENLGDAYEMAEEMFGMIWWLADALGASVPTLTITRSIVEEAQLSYREGLEIARRENGGA